MSAVSIYTTDPAIRTRLTELFLALARDGPEPIRVESFTEFSAFLDSARHNPRRILLLATPGPGSVELATTTAEEYPENPMVWLSDLDFGLFSFRLGVAHFGFLPGTEESLRIAMRNCRHRRGMTGASPSKFVETG